MVLPPAEGIQKGKHKLTGEGRSLGAKISWEGVVNGEYFWFLYKTRHILLSNGANCTVLRAVLLTQYRRVTDRQTDGQTEGQTDGNAEASTALAARCIKKHFSSCDGKL